MRRRAAPARRRWTLFELATMVLGFMVFWPIGLAVFAYKMWQRKSGADDLQTVMTAKWNEARASWTRSSGWSWSPRDRQRRLRPMEGGRARPARSRAAQARRRGARVRRIPRQYSPRQGPRGVRPLHGRAPGEAVGGAYPSPLAGEGGAAQPPDEGSRRKARLLFIRARRVSLRRGARRPLIRPTSSATFPRKGGRVTPPNTRAKNRIDVLEVIAEVEQRLRVRRR